ncbi:hypothetical protein EIP91_011540 [Steccherinum ochraceum]|uniref:Pali-domain-containing protein n=1 Tax=Steccherinum ochraceum TaxID=92696 RepID=A0A4V2MWZ0_9APHY|nr:hypothetical protein EIP91_011540 [Steccherinum ochraceum]
MGFIRPATPGFLVTLTATILLALVTFSVPYLKSIYFLKGSLTQEGIDGSITFGTLGYCTTIGGSTVCSKPSIGYELDINGIVGNKLPIQIPNVVVKWITYALFLHAVALILAAISAVFGLLAHVREMSMACCSTCVSGFSAAIALLAFIFDLVLFFITKSRINDIDGASASMGIGIWLTLAAWLLLFFAGCFYGFGRCCISRRPKRSRDREASARDDPYTEQLRLDAVKAEADRKARQKQGELGLPAFQEYQPLTKQDPEDYIEDGDQIVPLHSQQHNVGAGAYGRQPSSHAPPPGVPYAPGGYTQGAPGTRAVDDYYNQPSQQGSVYPPRRQASGSSYAPSSPTVPPLPPPTRSPSIPAQDSQYLAAGTGYAHSQYPSAATQNYGHTAGGTTYHSAASHQQYPSTYSTQFPDPFATQGASSFNPEGYNSTGYLATAPTSFPDHNYNAQSGYSAGQHAQPERSYTLGGDGYGSNTIPDFSHPAQYSTPAPYPTHTSPGPISPQHTPSPGPINTNVAAASHMSPTSPRGPRPPATSEQPLYEDSPPMYDAATAQPPGQWGAKH